MTPDYLEPSFEDLFQAFVAAGGLDATRALSEDFERSQRQREILPKEATRCRHGKTYLSCGSCYLNWFEGGHS